MNPRILVVGAGINGLCAAWQLLRHMPGSDILLVDRFLPGHGRGSSHGDERIIRSSYATAEWVRAMVYTRAELWPQLEADVGARLVHPGPAVFWGPEAGPIGAYSEAVRGAAGSGVHIEEIDVVEARRRFPHMRFPDAERVLHDHDAGVIAAARTMRALERLLADAGVRRLQARVTGLDEDDAGVTLQTSEGPLRAEHVVLAAGAWIRDLVPSLAPRAMPAYQHVGFWEMDVAVGRSPAWVHLGVEGLHYGLPTFDGEMKAAFHRTGTGEDDPDTEEWPDPAELERVREKLSEWFVPGPGARIGWDTCLYTNAPEDAFVLEEPPGHRRVLAVSACSGHAFKLAPHTGERVAAWVVGRG
jgi:sarcosine oxidase